MKRTVTLVSFIVFTAFILGGCGFFDLTYSISGRVTNGESLGIPDVTINLSGNGWVSTGEDGNWEKAALTGKVRVTPSKTGWVFIPDFRDVSSPNPNVDFTGIRQEPALTSIVVTPSSWNMEVGETKEFSVIGLDQSNNPIELPSNPVWSVSGDVGEVLTPYNLPVTTLIATSAGTGSLSATIGSIQGSAALDINQYSSPLVNVAASSNGGVASAGSTGTYMETMYSYYVNDEDLTTTWCNSWTIPDWCQVEFDNSYWIEEVRCVSNYNSQVYDIQLSQNGIDWTTVASRTTPDRVIAGQSEGLDDYRVSIAGQWARYIRVTVTYSDSPSTHIFKAILTEIQAYADNANLSSGTTTMRIDSNVQILDLNTVTSKLRFDTNASIPNGAIITEAYFEARIDHTYMRDMHIDVAHGTMIWTEFDPLTNDSPQTFSTYIPEWIGRLAKTEIVLWLTDEASQDVGYVDYWFVTIKWHLP